MRMFKKSAALSAALIGLMAASSMGFALPKGPASQTGSAAIEVTHESVKKKKKKHAAKAHHAHKHKKAHHAKKAKKVEKKAAKKVAEVDKKK